MGLERFTASSETPRCLYRLLTTLCSIASGNMGKVYPKGDPLGHLLRNMRAFIISQLNFVPIYRSDLNLIYRTIDSFQVIGYNEKHDIRRTHTSQTPSPGRS